MIVCFSSLGLKVSRTTRLSLVSEIPLCSISRLFSDSTLANSLAVALGNGCTSVSSQTVRCAAPSFLSAVMLSLTALLEVAKAVFSCVINRFKAALALAGVFDGKSSSWMVCTDTKPSVVNVSMKTSTCRHKALLNALFSLVSVCSAAYLLSRCMFCSLTEYALIITLTCVY